MNNTITNTDCTPAPRPGVHLDGPAPTYNPPGGDAGPSSPKTDDGASAPPGTPGAAPGAAPGGRTLLPDVAARSLAPSSAVPDLVARLRARCDSGKRHPHRSVPPTPSVVAATETRAGAISLALAAIDDADELLCALCCEPIADDADPFCSCADGTPHHLVVGVMEQPVCHGCWSREPDDDRGGAA